MHARHRVIPTRVGKAKRCDVECLSRSGHPHASGESRFSQSRKSAYFGSSPREWGKREPMHALFVPVRVIPTRVGKAVARGLAVVG